MVVPGARQIQQLREMGPRSFLRRRLALELLEVPASLSEPAQGFVGFVFVGNPDIEEV